MKIITNITGTNNTSGGTALTTSDIILGCTYLFCLIIFFPFTVLMTLLYAPSIVAGVRAHHQKGAIFLLCTFVPLVGWIIAMVLAVRPTPGTNAGILYRYSLKLNSVRPGQPAQLGFAAEKASITEYGV